MSRAVIAVALALVMPACAGLDAEDEIDVVQETIATASNSSDAIEAANLLRGPKGLRSEAVEAFHCDSTPDLTYVTVCGQQLPATAHLEWTDCAPPRRHGKDGPPPGADGGRPPPPPGADGGRPPRPGPGGDGGECGPGGPGGHGPGLSSGTVDIVYSYPNAADCTLPVVQEQDVTFSISRERKDGNSSSAVGTSSSTAELVDGGPPRIKETTLSVTRSKLDDAGTVLSSVQIQGSKTIAFSSDEPPVRTINGAFTETRNDGTTGSLTLTNVVQPPRDVCPWPTSGTLARSAADGGTDSLVYGPACGDATLNGAAVELESFGRGGKGGPGGGGGSRRPGGP